MAKNIYSVNPLDLLPESLHCDEDAVALAKAIFSEIRLITNEISQVYIFSRLGDLPEPVIDLLAWQLHVDFYDPELSLQQKREFVERSPSWHRIKGTPWAVETVSSILFPTAKVKEWFEYGGQPYYFKILIDLDCFSSSTASMKQLVRVIDAAKNKRSWLESIVLVTNSDQPVTYSIIFRTKVMAQTSIWAFESEKSLLINGTWTLDGSNLLGYGSEAETDKINEVRSRQCVKFSHPFHVYEENQTLELNGEWLINGTIMLDSTPLLVERMPTEHEVKMTSRNVRMKHLDGSWSLTGDVTLGQRIVDGVRKMDGSWKMNGVYNMDGTRTEAV